MNSLFGVYGASGCGRTVMPFLREVQATDEARFVFIDDGVQKPSVNGFDVLRWDQFVQSPLEKRACIAIAKSGVREAIASRFDEAGVRWLTCIAQQALVLDEARIGPGAIISPFATIGANAVVGRGLLADLYSCVNHDCVLGDFVTLAPYANINGNVVVEDHAYIGSGARIRQGQPGKPLVIGRGAVIGMGAIVTKDVPAGMTVVGNPARPLVKG